MASHILVTGASGFIGKAFCKEAIIHGFFVRAAVRRLSDNFIANEMVCMGEVTDTTDWSSKLAGVEIVVHLAARTHILKESVSDPLIAFRKANVDVTLNLARQASTQGVRQFIFISSIHVNGRESKKNKPFSELDKPEPHSAYAISKWEAEQGLMKIASETGLNVIIIRPPLVYGFDAPGNFGLLMHAVKRCYPLPFGAIRNKRSFVSLDNLVNFIITCIVSPQAINQIFLISDGEDLSTADLVYRMASVTNSKIYILSIPTWLLRSLAIIFGKADIAQSLCGNLQIDISKAQNMLGWTPLLSVDDGLRRSMIGH